jgi:hypothetical protein
MLSVMRQIGRRVIAARRAQRGEDPLPDIPATIQLVDVSSCDNFVSPNLDVYTCTVGKKPSAAANYIQDVDEVQDLLDSLVKVSTRDPRYYSVVDLASYAGGSAFSHKKPLKGSGVQRSASLSELATVDDDKHKSSQRQETVSTNLNQFLGLGTITDEVDEEEDAFFID